MRAHDRAPPDGAARRAGEWYAWCPWERTTWIALVASGVLVVLFSRQTVFGVGLAMFFLVAVPVAVLNTSISPLLLAATPRQYLGRMMSVFNPINQTASLISVGVSGWLASTVLLHFHAHVLGVSIGRIDTIFGLGGLLIAAAGVFGALVLPRRMPTEEAEGSTEPAASGEPSAAPTEPAAPNEPSAPSVQAGSVAASADPEAGEVSAAR